MLDYVPTEKVDVVLVQYLDRFGRSPQEMMTRIWRPNDWELWGLQSSLTRASPDVDRRCRFRWSSLAPTLASAVVNMGVVFSLSASKACQVAPMRLCRSRFDVKQWQVNTSRGFSFKFMPSSSTNTITLLTTHLSAGHYQSVQVSQTIT